MGDCQRGEFEIGQRNFAARRFHRFKTGNQCLVGSIFATQACPLVKHQKMRLDIQAHTIAGAHQDRFQHGAGRTLAIGAGHHDHRAFELQIKPALDLGHALQPHVDGFEMARFEQGEPFGQSFGGLFHDSYMGSTIKLKSPDRTGLFCMHTHWLHARTSAGWFCSNASKCAISSRILRRSTTMSIAPF